MAKKRKAEDLYLPETLKKHKFNAKNDCVRLKFRDVFDKIQIEADGNCLFRAIAFLLCGDQEKHDVIREEVCNHVATHSEEYEGELFETITELDEYLDEIREGGSWGDHLELAVLSRIFVFNVVVYHPRRLDIHSEQVKDDEIRSRSLFHLEYENYNHFNVLVPKGTAESYTFLQRYVKRKEDGLKMEMEPSESRVKITLSTSKTKIKAKAKEEISSSVDKIAGTSLDPNQDRPKRKVVILKKPKNTAQEEVYPLAKGGYDTYNEAFQYFKNGVTPVRIKNSNSLRNWKKDISRRYLLVKGPKSPLSHSRLQIKLKGNSVKTIPFKYEIPKLIEAAHNGFSQQIVKHNGMRLTLRNLESGSMQLHWASMSRDVTAYAENCIECIHEQPIKQIKVYKTIVAAGPFDRFTADLYKIPDSMIQASQTNHQYILCCVDHFSKFKWTELIPNKEASTVSRKLDLIFNTFRAPKYFQTDNGKEFQNSQVNEVCEKKNIIHINGRPYHPKSQGVVEKLNDLIAKSLTSSLLAFQNSQRKKENEKNKEDDEDYDNGKKAQKNKNNNNKKMKENEKDKKTIYWNIEDALKAWTLHSHKNIHSVTEKIPFEALWMKEMEEIEAVQNRVKRYYESRQKSKNIKDLEVKIGTKVFIIKEVRKVIGKNRLIDADSQNQKKKGRKKIRIPALITSISELDYFLVEIKICGEINIELDLKKNYCIGLDYLEIPKSEKSWNLLAKK